MTKEKRLTPLRAIKLKCKEVCCMGDYQSYKNCTIDTCPLWHFRFGKKTK